MIVNLAVIAFMYGVVCVFFTLIGANIEPGTYYVGGAVVSALAPILVRIEEKLDDE